MTTLHALSAFEQADLQRKLQLIADILTGDFDIWLAKQKAQWRRELLEEAAKFCIDSQWSETHGDRARTAQNNILCDVADELRRMAEQSESK